MEPKLPQVIDSLASVAMGTVLKNMHTSPLIAYFRVNVSGVYLSSWQQFSSLGHEFVFA